MYEELYERLKADVTPMIIFDLKKGKDIAMLTVLFTPDTIVPAPNTTDFPTKDEWVEAVRQLHFTLHRHNTPTGAHRLYVF